MGRRLGSRNNKNIGLQKRKQSTTRARRMATGLCIDCGTQPRITSSVCRECGDKRNLEGRIRRKKYLNAGKCTFCGRDNDGDGVRCKLCLGKRRKWEKKTLNNGICLCGGSLPLVNKRECSKCWFSRKAHIHLGSRKKWRTLEDLFIKQNYKCALTGDELVVGDGASIDHIIPVSKGGAVKDINNLQAITLDANHFKWTKTNEEVVDLCRKILKNLGN